MRIRFSICFVLVQILFSGNCLAESEIFKIRNRRAIEILPVIETVLSPQGRAVADKVGNMIIVNDRPEIIEEVRTLLLSSDKRMPQVRVQIAFESEDGDQTSGFKKSGRHLSTKDTQYRYANSGRKSRGNSFIMVSSGSSGYIRMAREVPVTERWIFFCRRYGVPSLLKETRTIETGMEVSPVAAGDQVIVTVTPRISWRENGKPESFRFIDAATSVTIPRSQWFDLGGMSSMSQSEEEILGTILSTDDASEESGFYLKIKADITD